MRIRIGRLFAGWYRTSYPSMKSREKMHRRREDVRCSAEMCVSTKTYMAHRPCSSSMIEHIFDTEGVQGTKPAAATPVTA